MIRKFVFMRKDSKRIFGESSVARTACIAFVILFLSVVTATAQSGPAITGFLVNGVASNIGPVGATLTIQGSGFGASIGFSTATLNGIAVAGAGVKPVSWTSTSIVAVIPQTASSGPVIVTVSGKPSNSVQFAIGPVITGLSSASGLAGTGVTISGQGFGTAGGTVAFNGMTASTSGWVDASILATVPTNATEGPIVVTVSGQASNGITFTPTPSIAGLSTYSGISGTKVTINGSSFGNSQVSGSSVTFDGVSASAISNWTNNSITATAPSGGTTGNVVVTVNSVPSAGVMFTYVPSITSLSPIPVLADGIITIGGTNFGAPLATDVVTLDGISATIDSWTNTSITAVVPGNVSAGVAVVSVNGVASNAFSFSLTSPYNFGVSYAPDGDVLTVNDNVNGNWVYAYDNFNRLSCSNLSSNGSCAKPTSGTPTYSYNYDQYGNRWQQNGPYTMLLTFSNTNNQMDGYSYDAAGNLLNDGNHAYTYDAENRIIQVDGGQTAAYAYDGDGQRIQKSVAGAVLAQYLHDLSGNTITELNASGVWDRSEIYAGGHHLATYGGGASGTTYFVQQDWLGTERARVLPNGDLSETCVSLPFGDGQTCTGSADPSPDHFTGKERDSESGLDSFGARYDASSMGRFMTPDWAAKPEDVPYANFGNPQSLNLYAYALNNPLNLVDTDGHDLVVAAELQTAVTLLRQESPSFNAELSAHEGPNSPNLTINAGKTPNDPDGSPSIGNTSAYIGGGPVQDCPTAECVTVDRPYNYKGATVTINDSVTGDKSQTQDVLGHEVGHVHDARTNTDQYHKDSQNTQQTKGKTPHDDRPEEQRANQFKDQVKQEEKQWEKDHCHGFFHKTCTN